MAFCVVYDACVLYPAMLRDLLLRLAEAELVRARWSEEILDECVAAILKNRPDLTAESLERTKALMATVVPDCLVLNYESLVSSLELPDPDDRHVLAAAIRCGAQAIVTFNKRDFPLEALAPFGIETKHPDDFVVETIDLAPAAVARIVDELQRALMNPPMSREGVWGALEKAGLVQSVARLRELR